MKNMRVLLDSNVIIDWLVHRQPFFEPAKAVIESCMFGNNQGFVTSHSLCDMYYILRKDFSTEQRLNFIRWLSERCKVIIEEAQDFHVVSSNPSTTDLEDGLQIQCAEKLELDYIITRNIKYFDLSTVPAISPVAFNSMCI